jgi:hypothetical protein
LVVLAVLVAGQDFQIPLLNLAEQEHQDKEILVELVQVPQMLVVLAVSVPAAVVLADLVEQ